MNKFTKIDQRNKKPHYTHLKPDEYKFVKSYEQVKQYENDMSITERINKNWRQTEQGQAILESYYKATKKKSYYSSKLNLTELQECILYNSAHSFRFSGSH